MKSYIAVFLCILHWFPSASHAQTPSASGMVVAVAHQYGNVNPNISPGELISLVAHGVGANLTSRFVAPKGPLPTSLAGVSVELRQPGAPQSVAVPIYSVIPLPACNFDSSIPPFADFCGTLAGITIQVPYELDIYSRLGPVPPYLIISENGQFKAAIAAPILEHHVHVATTGDDVQVQFPELQTGGFAPVIRHLDKRWVTGNYPAQPGETLSMWAVGLGQGVGKVKAVTGQPAPEGVVVEPGIDFHWGRNLPARMVDWEPGGSRPSDGIVSAGLIAGQVGIYEILFTVPDIPPDVPACSGSGGTNTNLTVSIGYPRSFISLSSTFDGGGICVAQPAATVRSQMARYLIYYLYQKLGYTDPGVFPFAQSPHFTDVPDSHPQYKYIQRMAELQIASDNASDCDPGAFCPDAQITNGQIAVWVVRAMQLRSDPCVASDAGCDLSVADSFTINSDTPYFSDVPPSHPYFRWIQKAKELNLIRPGDVRCLSGAGACIQYCPDGSFCPSGTTTVDQMTVWVGRAFFEYGR